MSWSKNTTVLSWGDKFLNIIVDAIREKCTALFASLPYNLENTSYFIIPVGQFRPDPWKRKKYKISHKQLFRPRIGTYSGNAVYSATTPC